MNSPASQTPIAPSPAEDVAAVIADVLRRRQTGEAITDDQVLQAHPAIRALQAELKVVHATRLAYLSARRAGPTSEPLVPLDPDELEAPISLDEAYVAVAARAPVIQGFQIGQELGSGGQAAVFRAIQESTNRVVAIKVMFGGPLLGSRHRRRFDREVAILAQIDHPAVVGILDRGVTSDGSFFFVMDFVEGRPIDCYVRSAVDAGNLIPTDLIKLWISVSRAVSAAHRLGIIHRDLKPSNILVDQSGHPHVMDFGLAHPTEESNLLNDRSVARSMTGHIVGSLPWASPEQVGGQSSEIRAASDVYSLGALFYQLLTGEFPYDVDGTTTELIRNISTSVVVAPSERLASRPKLRNGVGSTCGLQIDAVLATQIDHILLTALEKVPQLDIRTPVRWLMTWSDVCPEIFVESAHQGDRAENPSRPAA